MSVYVGMDVHRKRSQVAICDQAGAVLRNVNVDNDSDDLVALLAALPAATPVAFEAAYGWGWLAELLDDLQLEAHLVHPTQCKAIASARLKNDKVDAATLAHLLRTDLLPEAWLAPPAVRDLRGLLRFRVLLVRTRTGLLNRVHAVLADHNESCPHTLNSDVGRGWLATVKLPAVHRLIVDDCMALVRTLNDTITDVEVGIRRVAKPDDQVKALQSLPGVGPLTALMVVAEIGDITRFASARKLTSWAGLAPTVRNSDRKIRHGHISKQGSSWLRWALLEAAQTAKRHEPYAACYADIARRRGRNIAKVAVARKLLTHMYYLLHEVNGTGHDVG